MVVYDCNHGTWEAKAEGSGAQADPQLHRGLEAIVGHTRFCTIERKKNKIGKKKSLRLEQPVVCSQSRQLRGTMGSLEELHTIEKSRLLGGPVNYPTFLLCHLALFSLTALQPLVKPCFCDCRDPHLYGQGN